MLLLVHNYLKRELVIFLLLQLFFLVSSKAGMFCDERPHIDCTYIFLIYFRYWTVVVLNEEINIGNLTENF